MKRLLLMLALVGSVWSLGAHSAAKREVVLAKSKAAKIVCFIFMIMDFVINSFSLQRIVYFVFKAKTPTTKVANRFKIPV